jgi:hypothetical protein
VTPMLCMPETSAHEEDGHAEAQRCSQEGDDHRLGADHCPELRPGHADGTEQADLPRPFVDGKGEGVGDTQQGDDDGQDDERRHWEKDPVHLPLLGGQHLGAVQHVHIREPRERSFDPRPSLVGGNAAGQTDPDLGVELLCEVGLERAQGDDVVARDCRGGEGVDQTQPLRPRAGEGHGDFVADVPTVTGGDGVTYDHRSVGQLLGGRHRRGIELVDTGDCGGVDREHRLCRSVETPLPGSELGDDGDALGLLQASGDGGRDST